MYPMGKGFVLSSQEAQELVSRDPRNRDIVFPYLIGDDLNSRPDQTPSRWVINFHDWSLERAETYPDCLRILREIVKPEREKQKDIYGKRYWWRFLRTRPDLLAAIQRMERVLTVPEVSKYVVFTWQPLGIVYAHPMGVIASSQDSVFAILQSNLHELWARERGSTLETRMRYTPSDCFDTFPFPEDVSDLEDIGALYYACRQRILLARQEGLTKTYNRFHNPQESSHDIEQMRALHVEMDRAVAAAYGWTDLHLAHGFHETKQGLRFTISEAARREVLDRLLRLNHERYAEEVAQGLHDKGSKRNRKPADTATVASRVGVSAPQLFGDDEGE